MAIARPQCPHCENIELRRHARTGLWQRKVMPRLGYFPWECGQCREIFMLRMRAATYWRPLPSRLHARIFNGLPLKEPN